MSVDAILFSSVVSVATPAWLASIVLLLCLAAAAGLPLARHIAAPGAALILAPVIGLTGLVIVAALPIPFARAAVGGLLVVATLANLVLPRAPLSLARLNPGIWLGLGLLMLAFVWSATRPDAHMHYDYFHANMRSLDLARSGSVLSSWYASFDPTGWYLIDQSTSIVLDGLEIVWSGTDTGIISRLYAALLAASLVVLVGTGRHVVTTLLLAVALAIYAVDNAFTFRPHLYVGLCLALLAVLTTERPRGHLLASTAIVIALALAKRDGLVLAPVAALLMAMPFLRGLTHNPKLVAAAIAATVVALGAGLSLTRIGGVSVGYQLLASIGTTDLSNLLQRETVWYLAIVVALCIGAFLAVPRTERGRLIPALGLVVMTAALIIASAVLLEGAERFNSGTMMRKLVYFLGPLVLTFLALATSRGGARWLQGATVAALGLTVGALAYQLRDIRTPFTAWGVPAVAAVTFFRAAVPMKEARIGFYVPEQDDLALTPFGDTQAYQFPQMTAYLGRDLRFAATLEQLADRDVIFLPPSIPFDARQLLIRKSSRSYRELEGGYGMLIDPEDLSAMRSPLMLAEADSTPIDRPLERALWRDIEKTWPVEFGIAETPWPGGKTQVALAWPADPATWSSAFPLTFPNRTGAYVHRVEFRDHPLGDRTALSIAVTASGQTHIAPALEFFRDGRYVIPIEGTAPFTLSFTADSTTINPAWLVPYFVLFDLKLLQYEPENDQ